MGFDFLVFSSLRKQKSVVQYTYSENGVIGMNCMKCGRETISEQVFCPDCLAEMKHYPVRPGTVVQISNRKSGSTVKKQPRKKTVPLEEQVKILKKRCRTLFILLIVAIGIAIAMSVPALDHLMEDHFKIGQNYTTITATEGN